MLKTYSARTMAEALAQVKQDLGSDAVIVHTRTFKIGGVLGVGAKPVVEITASSDTSLVSPNTRRAPTRTVGRSPLAEPQATPPASTIEPKPAPTPQAPIVPTMAGAYTPPGAAAPVSSLLDTQPLKPQADPPIVQTPTARRSPADLAALASPPTPSQAPQPTAPTPTPTPASRPTEPTPPPARVVAPSTLEWPPPGFEPGQGAPQAAQPVSPRPQPQPEQPRPQPQLQPKPEAPKQRPAEPTPRSLHERVTPPVGGSVEQELGELRKLVGQVLQSTRRTEMTSGSAVRYDAPMPEPLMAQYMKLIDADVRADVADAVATEVRNELSVAELEDPQIVRATMLRRLETRLPVIRDAAPLHADRGRSTIVALIGPTGVGKTTSVAKLAATYKLRHGRNVGLITADTYRIAAVEQLRTYAGIIGLPLHVVRTPQETTAAIQSLRDMDVVVLDTAGRSQNDARRLDELKAHLDAATPDQTHLVLSTTVGPRVLKRTTERFCKLQPDRLILTKLDEAESLGLALDAVEQTNKPISFVTTGQEVPDDIEPADPSRLARLILDGPGSAEEGVGALEGTPG